MWFWRQLPQPPSQYADNPHRITRIPWKLVCNILPDHARQLGPIPIRAHHDLQRPITMDTAKEEIALRGHIGDVGRYAPLFAQLPYLRRRLWVIDSDEHHVGAIEVGGSEFAVDVLDLAPGDAVGDFTIQTRGRADDGDSGIGVEGV
jgi:hypothetical protein